MRTLRAVLRPTIRTSTRLAHVLLRPPRGASFKAGFDVCYAIARLIICWMISNLSILTVSPDDLIVVCTAALSDFGPVGAARTERIVLAAVEQRIQASGVKNTIVTRFLIVRNFKRFQSRGIDAPVRGQCGDFKDVSWHANIYVICMRSAASLSVRIMSLS